MVPCLALGIHLGIAFAKDSDRELVIVGVVRFAPALQGS